MPHTRNLFSRLALDTLKPSPIDPAFRDRILQGLVKIERDLPYTEGLNVREQITGSLADAVFAPGEIVTKTLADGTIFSFAYTSKIARDFVMAHQEFPDHVWEPQCTKLLLHLTKEAKNVLIGGAYFGDHAVLIAKQIKGTVHCFEMNSDNAAMLDRNAKQNEIENLRINVKGLWSKPGLGISLADGQDSHASSHLDMGSNTATETIDRYCTDCDISKLDLILLDIEGAEEEALKGAERLLKLPKDQAPILVYEIHRSYVDWSNGLRNARLIKWLADFGYESLALRDYQTNFSMAGKPIELVTLDDIYLEGPPHGFNMVAVKDRGLLTDPSIRFVSGVSPKLLFHRDPRWHAPTES